MSSFLRPALVAVFLFLLGTILLAQTRLPGPARGAEIWQDVDERSIATRATPTTAAAPISRDIVPQVYRTLQLDKSALRSLLGSAPPEFSGPIETTGAELLLPLPSGGFGRFRIQESPILEPELAAQFPELKTYVGQGIDDPTATMRADLTPRGFHAIILSASGQIYIDPYSRDADTNYISYFKRDFTAADKAFSCDVQSEAKRTTLSRGMTLDRPTGATLRTYRLALACTGEYATKVCSPNAPTVAATLAAMTTSANRCTAVYEREFSIRFVLINNNSQLIYLSGSTDPYTNDDGFAMLGENQSNVDSVIGSANYDFGHVLSTGGGGVASLGVICVSGAKARGVTGSPNPVGDPFDIDYVAHEMGHQFGANHPFNGTGGYCSGGNRNSSTAYEPGSGSTIMAYAGICSPQNLATHSSDYFHTISYDEIDSYTSNGSGNSCDQATSTGNTPPAIAALSSFTIPAQTAFALTASATDPNGDTLTYCWEEFDLGPAQDPTASPRDNGSSPIFRSFPPTTNPTRTFPSLTYILNNANTPPATMGGFATGEFLPTTSRTMTYRVTVRDNRAGGGGSNYASTTVSSVSTAGPFVITAPNSAVTIPGGSQQTVTWNVAGTSTAPINCANVKISFSTNGGSTFPVVLTNSVPNNGSAAVTIPNSATTQGRIKVEAVSNIFFDISDANLTITSSNPSPVLTPGTPSAPSAESCSPANGIVDPGETVTLSFPINNVGSSATTNLVATLQASGGVTPITVSQNYGPIASNGSVTRPFQFSVSGTCGGNVTVTLQLQDGSTNHGNITYTIPLGLLSTSTTPLQNFDGITPPALPAGWTALVASGAMAPWATNTISPHTAPNSVSANTVATVSDNRLTSPSIGIPSISPQLSFYHRWNLESGYDGGILEISINGSAFANIIAAGGSFVSGGYNGTISTSFSSPIGGSQAWTGDVNTNYTATLVNLPPAAAGQNAQFRWRLASDSTVSASGAGWRVDSISLISSSYTCSVCPSAPAITNGPPPSPIAVGTPYSFAFTATGNPGPTFGLKSGTLPPGITLSSSGVLSGTTTDAGTGNFPNITVTASNGNPPDAEQTFSLTVVSRATNYLNSYGLTGENAALLFDYDGDGILNLMEYAQVLDPTLANIAGLPVVIQKKYHGSEYLFMIFTRSSAATDLTYIVQVSSDLAGWTDLASSVAGGPTSGPGFVDETGSAPIFTVEVRDIVPIEDAPDGKRFIRLKVTSP